jgi:DegV family protein with EDD domain
MSIWLAEGNRVSQNEFNLVLLNREVKCGKKKLSKKRAAGIGIDEVYDWVISERLKFNEVGTVENLTYLRNAGRVSASAAFFGGIFSIKPMIVYDETGHNVAVEKVRGRKTSLEKTAEYIIKYADLDTINTIFLSHADCLDDCKYVAEIVKSHFPDKNIEFHFGFIEPGIGYSVGPGTVIANFYGDPAIRQLNK